MATVEQTENTSDSDQLTSNGLLKRDRYVATNRFAVRKDKGPKFEARWANRKSRLSELDGFKYFHLMRRVELNNEDGDGITTYSEGDKKDGSNMGNYVSFTIWDKKSHFSAWRKGDAFKEAHGGTSISAFMSTMISSAMILRGAPRPAFYDGLLFQSVLPAAEDIPETVDGWRNVEADGIVNLPVECFVATNQFFVSSDNAMAFEQRWASRESKLKECEGFVAFSMMRRDTGGKGHGVVPMDEATEPTYLSTTIWKDRASFDKWREGTAFRKAHGAKPPSEQVKGAGAGEDAKPPPPLWSQPPKPIFYEGTLVISKPEGA
jgi:heme-degrading monooxygenase HmoA